jgi:hypothetical protein
MLFKVPGQRTWCGMEALDKARVHPDTLDTENEWVGCPYAMPNLNIQYNFFSTTHFPASFCWEGIFAQKH